jgi:outer membrane lipoprotein-sorting protein
MIDLIKEFKGIDLTVEEIKDVLIDEYRALTDNYKNQKRIINIINILREEGQFDANQLQDETINFEQLVLQEGFGAVNFDMWILLFKYEIPSIFISSKEIPETRFNKKEFVCYADETHEDKFVFIITPAMYRRSKLKNPEYKLIVSDQEKVSISLSSLIEGECSQNIKEAINIAYPISKYIDEIFEKDNTTKYKKRQKKVRDIEFMEVSQSALVEDLNLEQEARQDVTDVLEIEPKKVIKLKKGRKLKPTIVLEEEEDIMAPGVEETDESEFVIELPPSDQKPKKKKTKRKQANIKFNPPGKTKKNVHFSV